MPASLPRSSPSIRKRYWKACHCAGREERPRNIPPLSVWRESGARQLDGIDLPILGDKPDVRRLERFSLKRHDAHGVSQRGILRKPAVYLANSPPPHTDTLDARGMRRRIEIQSGFELANCRVLEPECHYSPFHIVNRARSRVANSPQIKWKDRRQLQHSAISCASSNIHNGLRHHCEKLQQPLNVGPVGYGQNILLAQSSEHRRPRSRIADAGAHHGFASLSSLPIP